MKPRLSNQSQLVQCANRRAGACSGKEVTMQTMHGVLLALAFASTVLEAAHAVRNRRPIFSRAELSADLRVALVGFAVVALHRGAFLGLYALVYARLGLAWGDVDTRWAWMATFV